MNDNVSFIDSEMIESVSHLVEVDLQDNLLWQWEEVLIYYNLNFDMQSLLHSNRTGFKDWSAAATAQRAIIAR